MGALARKLYGDLIDVEEMTIEAAPQYVLTRADCAIAANAILSDVGARIADVSAPAIDGVCLACFGEPGLKSLREIVPVPVVGMLESSVVTALQMGERFSIVTPGADWPAMLMEMLQAWSLAGRCAGISQVSSEALSDDFVARAKTLNQEARAHLKKYPTDVLIVGGGALAGRSTDIAPMEGVVILDSFIAALGQIIGLVRIRRASCAITNTNKRYGS